MIFQTRIAETFCPRDVAERKWPLLLLVRLVPQSAQRWCHSCYDLYEAAHFLAHKFHTRKIFVKGLPMYLHPEDF